MDDEQKANGETTEQPGEAVPGPDLPTITFVFKDQESVVFQYSRNGVNFFQLAVVARVLQTVVEMEMAAWHAQVVNKGMAGKILVPNPTPPRKYRGD